MSPRDKTMTKIIEEWQKHADAETVERAGLLYAKRVQDLRRGSRTSRHTAATTYVRARARQEQPRVKDYR